MHRALGGVRPRSQRVPPVRRARSELLRLRLPAALRLLAWHRALRHAV